MTGPMCGNTDEWEGQVSAIREIAKTCGAEPQKQFDLTKEDYAETFFIDS